jgi:hypothetical protein
MGPTPIPHSTSQEVDTNVDMIPKHVDSMKTLPCPEVTAVDMKHNLTYKTFFICPQNIVSAP